MPVRTLQPPAPASQAPGHRQSKAFWVWASACTRAAPRPPHAKQSSPPGLVGAIALSHLPHGAHALPEQQLHEGLLVGSCQRKELPHHVLGQGR